MKSTQPIPTQQTSIQVIIGAGALILALSFGVRSVFGGVVEPLSAEFGWNTEVYSFSLALQNLVWGLAQPFFGFIADRFGDRRALWLGFLCYLAGMALAVIGTTPLMQHLGAGVLVGMGVSGTAFGLVLAVVARASTAEKRSMNLGLTSALGSLGQVAMPFIASFLLEAYDWQTMLTVMAVLLLPMALCIPLLKTNLQTASASKAADAFTIGQTLRCAVQNSNFVLLSLGFFVCGFHVAFIAVHFPAYVSARCGDAALGLQALSLIGLMNVLGTLLAGKLGGIFPKNYILSAIYALRALVIFVFISVPTTPLTVVIFSIAIGPLWLSTVPLTSGIVATMYGPASMGALYGIVFFSHQLGSFIGIYMGGVLYDIYNSYDIIWFAAVGLGVLSAILHLPVRDREATVSKGPIG